MWVTQDRHAEAITPLITRDNAKVDDMLTLFEQHSIPEYVIITIPFPCLARQLHDAWALSLDGSHVRFVCTLK